MFKSIKQFFSKSNKDLRKRIYITLLGLGIFCLGTNITIPWAKTVYEELGFLEIFNIMSGGGLKQFSIFALGVSPYITASIITQLLQMDIVPYFKELKEEGYTGRQKINRITRYLGIVFAFAQAYAFTIFYMGSSDVMVMLKTSLVMTAGTSLLLWIGDEITNKGIGNGQSLMIMAGIIQSTPTMFKSAFNGFVNSGSYSTTVGSILFAVFILIYVAVIVGVTWIQLAERRIPIQYANRTTSAYGGQQSFLPIKINSAGVMPVIFASVLVTIPVTIAQFAKKQVIIDWMEKWIANTSVTGFILYMVLIFFFGYFYTFISMNPEEMSKNLNENGGYVPGVRPGKDTSDYISKTLGKLTFIGSIFLIIIAGLPIIFSAVSNLPKEYSSQITIGGTGILIVVGVAIETYKQIESNLAMKKYSSRRRRG